MPWYKFADNKYYAKETKIFNCTDGTPLSQINASDGAEQYSGSSEFAAWAKRDLGSTFETYDEAKPGTPYGGTAVYENGALMLTWEKPDGNIWHYNVYMIDADRQGYDYRDLLDWSFEERYIFSPKYAGKYLIYIEAESNTGVIGAPFCFKINLK